MKMRNFLNFCILLCVLMASCSDDHESVIIEDLPLVENGMALDVTNGYNSIIIDMADEYKGVPLHTKLPVSFSNSNSALVDFEQRNIEGREYLYPVLKQSIHDLKPFSTRLRIRISSEGKIGDDVIEKDVMVSFRNSSSKPTDEDMSYAHIIGHGYDITQDPTITKNYPLFDFNAIYENLQNNFLSQQKGVFFEIYGHDYEKCIEEWGVSVGLSAVMPVPKTKGKYKMSGSVSYSRNESHQSEKYHEYYLSYYRKEMAQASLNWDWVQKTVGDSTGIGWAALLSEEVNDILNNPGSELYQKYANDTISENNIFTLLERYGTHVIMQGTFGGAYFTLYSREDNAYSTTISNDLSASFSVKQKQGQLPSNFAEYYAAKTGSNQVNMSFDGSYYTSDYEEASNAWLFTMSKGGDGEIDMEAWDGKVSTENKDKWVAVSFTTTGTSASDPGLIPIYYLIGDSARYKAVMEYIGPFVDRQSQLPTDDSPVLLADFMMKTAENGQHAGEPKSFVAEDQFGIKRIYYPMMANKHFPNSKYHEHGAETSGDDFIVCDDHCEQYWYYALGHRKDRFYGITDIIFAEKKDGYTARGDASDKDMGEFWPWKIPSNKVLVKFATEGTSDDKLIKAVGLKSGKVFASSGGSEMRTPFETDTFFDDYWSKNVQGSSENWYHGSNGFKTSNEFHPVYSCEPIRKNLREIQHPKTWD